MLFALLGKDRVTLTDLGWYVTIIQDSTGSIFMIRHWKDHYFFTMRMATELNEESTGLLVTGCPHDEVIKRGKDKQISIAQNKFNPSNATMPVNE